MEQHARHEQCLDIQNSIWLAAHEVAKPQVAGRSESPNSHVRGMCILVVGSIGFLLYLYICVVLYNIFVEKQ